MRLRPRIMRVLLVVGVLVVTRAEAFGQRPAAGQVVERPGAPGGRERMAVELGARTGFATAPFPSPDQPTASGLLTSLLVEVRGWRGPRLGVRIRLPLVIADLDRPAGGVVTKTAVGHPEAAVLWRLGATPAICFLSRLAVSFPLGGESGALGRRPLVDQALVLASAQTGWYDQELFAPGRLTITPSWLAELTTGRVRAFGEVKARVMFRLDDHPADPGVTASWAAVSAVPAVGASLRLWRLRGGVRAWGALEMVSPAAERGGSAPRWTLAVEPELAVATSVHTSVALSATVPVAGALQGTVGGGVQLVAAF
jgi:hypothetical protein